MQYIIHDWPLELWARVKAGSTLSQQTINEFILMVLSRYMKDHLVEFVAAQAIEDALPEDDKDDQSQI